MNVPVQVLLGLAAWTATTSAADAELSTSALQQFRHMSKATSIRQTGRTEVVPIAGR
jgi:hypothetical protein